ncbi:unnamed protein product, partial [Amoebophrya sp. A120]|eukprot:GSA120T00000859001.1
MMMRRASWDGLLVAIAAAIARMSLFAETSEKLGDYLEPICELLGRTGRTHPFCQRFLAAGLCALTSATSACVHKTGSHVQLQNDQPGAGGLVAGQKAQLSGPQLQASMSSSLQAGSGTAGTSGNSGSLQLGHQPGG